MAHKQFILIALVIGMLLILTGCGMTNGKTGAQRRWDRVIEQARFDAAQESIEQGRLDYAILLLEDLVETNSAFAEQAREMLAELRKVRQEFAQARDLHFDIEQQIALN